MVKGGNFLDFSVCVFFFFLCPQDHRKFGQRYYEYLDHLRVPDGPIFLMICGEGPCNGIPNDYLSVLIPPPNSFFIVFKES